MPMTTTMPSFVFSFSFSLNSFTLPTKVPGTPLSLSKPFTVLCALPSTSTAAPSPKKKIWKVGEYPGRSEFSIPKKKRTPIKNIKKKLDKKNNAKAWANTVPEALSESIEKKQWMQALEVPAKPIATT